MRDKAILAAVLGALLGVLPGCSRVSLSEVESFGSAADTLAESGLDAYGLLNDAATAQLIVDVASLPPSSPADAAATRCSACWAAMARRWAAWPARTWPASSTRPARPTSAPWSR